jgi:hypothetical protein
VWSDWTVGSTYRIERPPRHADVEAEDAVAVQVGTRRRNASVVAMDREVRPALLVATEKNVPPIASVTVVVGIGSW